MRELSDEMKGKLEIYCDIKGVDELHILDCDSGLFPVFYVFQNRADAFECVRKAAEFFYGSIYADDEIPEQLQRVQEAVEAHLYVYHQDPSVWGEPIRCIDLPEIDYAADSGFDSLPQTGNGIVGDEQCAFISFMAHYYNDLQEVVLADYHDGQCVYLIFDELDEETKANIGQICTSFVVKSGFSGFRWGYFTPNDGQYKELEPIVVYKKRTPRNEVKTTMCGTENDVEPMNDDDFTEADEADDFFAALEDVDEDIEPTNDNQCDKHFDVVACKSCESFAHYEKLHQIFDALEGELIEE